MALKQEVQRLIVKLQGDISHYATQMKAAEIQAQRFALRVNRSLMEVSKTLEVVGKKMTQVGKSLTMWVTMPILGVAAASVKAFANFDQAMTESLSIMQTTASEERRMKELALELASQGTKGPDELARSYFYLASAGLNAKQSMAALPIVTKFATAGAFDMAQATDLLTDAQTALGMEMDAQGVNMKKLGDAIIRSNQLANASAQQFSEALTSDAGVAARNFGMELKTTMAVLSAYASSGKKGAEAGNLFGRATRLLTASFREHGKAFDAYGIRVIDKMTGEYRNFIDIVADMENAFKGMTAPEIGKALEDLGFEALAQKSLLPLIGMSEQMKKWEEDIGKNTTAMEDVYAKQMQSFTNQTKILWNQLKILGIEIGSALVPYLQKFQDKIKELIKWWNGLSQSSKEYYMKMAAFIAALGPAILVIGKMSTALSILTKTTFNLKLGFYGLAVAGIAVMVKSIYNANEGIATLNKEMEKSRKLADDFSKATEKGFEEVDAKASELTGESKVKYLQEQLDMLGKEQAGVEARSMGERKDIAHLKGTDQESRHGFGWNVIAGGFRSMVGNKMIGVHEQALADNERTMVQLTERRVELEKQLEAAKAEVLPNAIKEVEQTNVRLEAFKKMAKQAEEVGTRFSWAWNRGANQVKESATGLFRKGINELDRGLARMSAQSPWRANVAVRGGTMEEYQAREFQAKYQTDMKEKERTKERDKARDENLKKQTEALGKMVEIGKKQLIPFNGIASFVKNLQRG